MSSGKGVLSLIQISLKEFLGKTAFLDVLSGILKTEPGIGIHLAIHLQRRGIIHIGGEVQHQRIASFKVFAAIEVNLCHIKAGFLLDLTCYSSLRILSTVHIACNQNVVRSAILLDQKDLAIDPVYDNHDACGVEDRKMPGVTGRTELDLTLTFHVTYLIKGTAFCAIFLILIDKSHSDLTSGTIIEKTGRLWNLAD